jgi:NAD(P)-dependent dehydrogenase (short-subunit alcohol dehydrogenase family)
MALQVAISFDTTGSMSAVLDEVRKTITKMIKRLKREAPGVTVSVIAHGDYCDTDIYVTKHVDFTDDEYKLSRFVRDVEPTGGGDPPECYELVLRLARTQLSWRRNSKKYLIVIGDSYPHPASDPQTRITLTGSKRLCCWLLW